MVISLWTHAHLVCVEYEETCKRGNDIPYIKPRAPFLRIKAGYQNYRLLLLLLLLSACCRLLPLIYSFLGATSSEMLKY